VGHAATQRLLLITDKRYFSDSYVEAMLNLAKKTARHEALFLERYRELMDWSLKVTGNDQNKADDLVHDAYIQWTLVRPDLDSIHNLDGYLYGMLRNMYAAELRRSLRNPTTDLSVIEYDSARLSLLRASDELHVAYMQDQLRKVCDYACKRKETSKAGSLLLLRFFHGYYPSEAALIAGITRVAVDSWLRLARAEAKLYLEKPEALKFFKENRNGRQLRDSSNTNATDFLDEISDRIFHSCQNRCLGNKKLRAFYSSAVPERLNCESLAHIASCETCLEKASKILQLPPKTDRYPPDRLGRDPRPGEKSLGKKNGRRAQGPQRLRLNIEDVIEHRPKELHVAVNGFTVGTHKITSDSIEHSLKLSLPEQIGFIEILSEQGIRLLSLFVEPPPDGPIERSALVELCDDRTLSVNLSFIEPWPELELTYSDPHFAEVAGDPEHIKEDREVRVSSVESLNHEHSVLSLRKLISSKLKVDWLGRRFWLRPSVVSALFALLLAVAFVSIHRTPLAVAAELLQSATAVEQATYIRPNEIAHRQIAFEQRRVPDGALVAQQTIEVWRDGTKGYSARRLYDHSGALVAGAWRRDQNAQEEIFYKQGAKLKLPASSQNAAQLVLTDHAWLVDLSAANFSSLVRDMESGGVKTKANQYILEYRRTPNDGQGLLQATLILDRTNLRATGEALLIAQGNEKVALTFTESSFERKPAINVDQKIFEPDAQLLGLTTASIGPVVVGNLKPPSSNSLSLPRGPAELTALEVDILYLLDQVNANSGEQVEIRRLATGELLVQALVETDPRKEEILKALTPVAGNPMVQTEVLTVEEALKRQSGSSKAPATLDRVVFATDRILVYEEVRRHLEHEMQLRAAKNSQISAVDLDSEVQRFSSRMINASQQALLHAFALKHLVERFSADDLSSLDEGSRNKWYGMIRAHAGAFRESTRVLRRDLGSLFPQDPQDHGAAQNDEDGFSIANDSALAETVANLVKLALANDEAVSQAFAIQSDPKSATGLGSAAFWSDFNRADNLAVALQRIESRGISSDKR